MKKFLFQALLPKPRARVVIFMGSPSDMDHAEKIREVLKGLGVPCELRVTSAHKGTDETMKLLAEYEGDVDGTVLSR